MAPAALRMLLALVKCTSMDSAVMAALNVLPAARVCDWASAIPSTACPLCDLPAQLLSQRLAAPPADSTTPVSPSGHVQFGYYTAWTDASHPLSQPLHPAPHLNVNGMHAVGSQAALTTASSSSSQVDGATPVLNSLTPANPGTPKAQPGTPRGTPGLPHPLADACEHPSQVDVAPLISLDDSDDDGGAIPASTHAHTSTTAPASTSGAVAGASVAHTLGAAAGELESMQASSGAVDMQASMQSGDSLDAAIDEIVQGLVEAAIRDASKELQGGAGCDQSDLLQDLGAAGTSGPSESAQGEPLGQQEEAEASSPEPSEAPPEPPAVPCAAHVDTCYELQGSWLVDALFDILRTTHLPVHSLWHATYLLQQWLHRPQPAAGDDTGAGTSTDTPTRPAGAWACSVSTEQRHQLAEALTAAGDAALREMDGMWSEAFFSLLYQEWGMAADAIQLPLLRTSSELIMVGPHLYPAQPSPPQVRRGLSWVLFSLSFPVVDSMATCFVRLRIGSTHPR